jgi:hypothetical protein
MRFAKIILIGALLGCSDSLLAPNTDVGLRVWVEVLPRFASVSDTTATIRIRLYFENPSSSELTIISGAPPYRFTANPAGSIGLSGSIRIAGDADSLFAGPSTDWWGQPVYTFRPRSRSYEESLIPMKTWRSGGSPVKPGKYRVRGWFNGREGKSAMLILKP